MMSLKHQNSFYVCVFPFSRSRFCNLRTMGIWGQVILCYGDCLMHCTMLNSIPGLYPLGVSNTTPHIVTIKDVSRYCQMSFWGAKSSPLRTIIEDHTVFRTEIISQLFSSPFMSVAECPSGERYSVLWRIDFTFPWIHLNWRVLFFWNSPAGSCFNLPLSPHHFTNDCLKMHTT